MSNRRRHRTTPAFNGRLPYGGGSSDFTPVALGNLVAWFRYGQGITSAASAVSQWNDQSGNVRHLKQSTGAAQPTLQADGSIQFDGTSDFLKCDPFTFVQPLTVYLLLNPLAWTTNATFFDGNTALTTIAQQRGVSPNVDIFAGVNAASRDVPVGSYSVECCVFNGASSVHQTNTAAAVTGNASTNNPGGFLLGARATPGSYSNIQIKEVVLYSVAHDATARSSVIAYLSKVGGL